MMARLNVALLSLWLAFMPALAQVGIGNQPNYAQLQPAPGGGSPTWTGQVSSVGTACGFGASCSFTSITVTAGEAIVVIGYKNDAGAGITIASASLCGTPLTPIVNPTVAPGDFGAYIGHATVAGGSCTLTFANSSTGAVDLMGFALGTLNNLSSTTPGTSCLGQFPASQASPYNCTGGLTVSAGGFGIVGHFSNNNGAFGNPTGNNLTVDSAANASGKNVAIGSVTTTTATLGFNGNGFANATTVGAPWR